MNTDMEEQVSIPLIVTTHLYRRNEWGRDEIVFNENAIVYGKEDGEYFVTGANNHKLRIPKVLVKKANTLKCEGWGYPCDRTDAWKEHMNTQYEHEESNYAILCPECWKECNEHWKEMWADYYSNCM